MALRAIDGRGTMEQGDLELRGGCGAPGQGRGTSGGSDSGGGDGGIRALSSRFHVNFSNLR